MDISKINPWVDPAPSKNSDMRLNQIRQQIKKKKPWAYRYLATRYSEGGRGLKSSNKKAISNYKKGKILGDPVCMTMLGRIYQIGIDVTTNTKLALTVSIFFFFFLHLNPNLVLFPRRGVV